MMLTATILYVYFLKIHNNGRLLDTYHRLHGEEDDFLVPYDLEVSSKELTNICVKSEAWRGNEGEIRKIIVNDFVWQEEADDELAEKNSRKPKEEITVHVAIFTVHLDGLRELYRQFLRLPDGAILEVFGDISTARMLPDVKASLMRKQANFENDAANARPIIEMPTQASPTISRAASIRATSPRITSPMPTSAKPTGSRPTSANNTASRPTSANMTGYRPTSANPNSPQLSRPSSARPLSPNNGNDGTINQAFEGEKMTQSEA